MIKILLIIVGVVIAIIIGSYVIRMDENYSNTEYFSDKSEKFTSNSDPNYVSKMYNLNSTPNRIYLKPQKDNCPYQNVPF